MKKLIYCFLCALLLVSCGKTGNGSNNVRTATSVETGQNADYNDDALSASKTAYPKVSQKALEHIINRHWSASDAQGAGKFAPDVTVTVLREMIETTAAQGTFRANTHGRPGKIAEYNFRKTIGTTINGSPASRLRVVIAPNGNVITAFPY